MLTVKGKVIRVVEDKTQAGKKFYIVQILQEKGKQIYLEDVYFYGGKSKPSINVNTNVEIEVNPVIIGRGIRLMPVGFEEEEEERKEPDKK